MICIYRDSGVGDHGSAGIQTFLDDHVCGPVCRKLRLEDLASVQDTSTTLGTGPEGEANEFETDDD